MWTIRQQQLDAFHRQHLLQFEDSMALHLSQFAPKHWRVIGDQTGREVIRFGIDQAKRYGFTNRGPVRFYLELMFIFGSYFDTDPQLPWIRPLLNPAENANQMVRADRLFAAFNQYIARVRGLKHEYFIAALKRLLTVPLESLLIAGTPLEDCAVRAFEAIYPEPLEYLGEAALRTVIRRNFATGQSYGLTDDKALLLMVGFGCFMGHGFANDPLCGWIGRRLDSKQVLSEAHRTEELYNRGMLYLKQVLARDSRENT
ncbi:MAG TPA: hypothetical protein VKZ53_09570 [Candidatus Angelobacter sp.]|nr:hypothetical protein [Candidatus Angelobacter sp.]